MNGAELAGVVLGGIGAVTGIAGLAISYRSAKASEVSANAAKDTVDFQIETYKTERTAVLRFITLNEHGHTVAPAYQRIRYLWKCYFRTSAKAGRMTFDCLAKSTG
jgi:hypothetical protein